MSGSRGQARLEGKLMEREIYIYHCFKSGNKKVSGSRGQARLEGKLMEIERDIYTTVLNPAIRK